TQRPRSPIANPYSPHRLSACFALDRDVNDGATSLQNVEKSRAGRIQSHFLDFYIGAGQRGCRRCPERRRGDVAWHDEAASTKALATLDRHGRAVDLDLGAEGPERQLGMVSRG